MRGVTFVKLVQFVKFVGAGAVLVVVGVLGRAGVEGTAAAETRGFLGEAGREAVRFVPVEVMVDSGKVGLGAYQIEVTAPEGVEIVGLEGGENGVFHDAPFYDPAALMGRRIVVAAFSTEGSLPQREVRVARLHLQVTGGAGAALPELKNKLVVATDGAGRTIEARVTLKLFEGGQP